MKKDRKYFFEATTEKDRFRTGDKPVEQTYRNLIDSTVFYSDIASDTSGGIVSFKNSSSPRLDYDNLGYPVTVGPMWVQEYVAQEIAKIDVSNDYILSVSGTGASWIQSQKSTGATLKTILGSKNITITDSTNEITISERDKSQDNPWYPVTATVSIKRIGFDFWFDSYLLGGKHLAIYNNIDSDLIMDKITLFQLSLNGILISFTKQTMIPIHVIFTDVQTNDIIVLPCTLNCFGTQAMVLEFNRKMLDMGKSYNINIIFNGLTINVIK